jgi:hypothetical protein
VSQAIAEVLALPKADPLRDLALKLVASWTIKALFDAPDLQSFLQNL